MQPVAIIIQTTEAAAATVDANSRTSRPERIIMLAAVQRCGHVLLTILNNRMKLATCIEIVEERQLSVVRTRQTDRQIVLTDLPSCSSVLNVVCFDDYCNAYL